VLTVQESFLLEHGEVQKTMSIRARVHLFSSIMMFLAGASLFSFPCYAGEDEKLNLNLHIAPSPILPPILNSYASDDYMSLYANKPSPAIQSNRHYAFGLVRFKADKTLRIRGWEISQNVYFGQAKIGKKWGVGLVVDRGSHYYGLNNHGISYLKKF